MDMQNILKIAKKIKIPEGDINSIIEYLEHDEWGIAFEVLCSVIELKNISISISSYNDIRRIGESMKMDKQLWECFKI